MVEEPAEAAAQTGQSAGQVSRKAHQLVQGMGVILSNAAVYGPKHSVTVAAAENCFRVLTELLREKENINIAVVEDALHLDGAPCGSSTPAVQTVAEHLSLRGIASFSLNRGIEEREFSNVMELLDADPEEMKAAGGFGGVIAALGLEHVKAKKVTIAQITEDEMIVNKEKLSHVMGEADVEKVVQFMRGNCDAGVPEVAGCLQACASDAKQAYDMVIQAAAGPGAGVAGSADQIVGSVRRLYDYLSNSPKAQTQKGKKELLKFLEQIDSMLVESIRRESGADNTEAEEKVDRAFEEMMDELRIDSLAGEYARKKNGASNSEERILRYIKTAGWAMVQKTGLGERLMEEGLTPEEWEELLEKSGVVSGTADEKERKEEERARLSKSFSELSASISRLADLKGLAAAGAVAETDVRQQDVEEIVARINEVVAGLAGQTEERIARFAKKVQGKGDGKVPADVTRRDVLEFLAELVQELRQPLAVVTSVVDTLKTGMLGAMGEPQLKMLGLAETSAQRLDLLITKLADISGMPDTLSPDAQIIDSIYGNRK